MKQFTPRVFTLPELRGISAKTIEEHLKLYVGYVKNANLIMELALELSKDAEKYAYVLGELQRRYAFEFCGMRNHEIYFSSLENGSHVLDEQSLLKKKIETDWCPFPKFLENFKALALTRGIGWAMLFYDKKTDQLITQWVDEQHLGHLTDCSLILALDMWEHSYVADYQPSGKKQYIEDYFANVNWRVIEENFLSAKQ